MSRVSDNKTDYMDRVFGLKYEYLSRISRASREEGVLSMQPSLHEGRILSLITQIAKAKKAVEIGTLYGFSALHIARALPKDGKIWTCDKNADRQKKAQEILKNCPEYQKIQWVAGPALKTLPLLADQGPFDLVFIDADKEAYGDYLLWAQKNLRPGGVLLADNTFLFGAVYGEGERGISLKAKKTMEDFNLSAAHSDQWSGALIPTGEGLTLAVKKPDNPE